MPKAVAAVLNGVNLNMLGQRDPAHYGRLSLEDINRRLSLLAEELELELDFFQSNSEGDFIEHIHSLRSGCVQGVLLNAGAWTHYSYALSDALAILTVPVVEVHLSHVAAREEFRRRSVLSPVVRASVSGFGAASYELALRGLAALIRAEQA